MGKPTSPSLRPSADAVSLHSQPSTQAEQRYFDDPDTVDDVPQIFQGTDDDDDQPPLYSTLDTERLLPTASTNVLDPFVRDAGTGNRCYLDKRLDNDPKSLETLMVQLAQTPPRPFVRLHGTHFRTVDENGKKERREVTDFDLRIELTPYLYSSARQRKSWMQLRTVLPRESTRRGTVFNCYGPKQDAEAGVITTLQEWCHRYCASHAALKTFGFRREFTGFNQDKVSHDLENLVRATNYRGRLSITFPVHDCLDEVYNDCRINRWRLTNWIRTLFTLSLLFIFTWPLLFFFTKKWQVIVADWQFSRLSPDGNSREYVSLTEDEFYNMWGRALSKAVLEKRQCTLDQQDLLNAEGSAPTFSSGNRTVDGAFRFVMAGVDAMNEVNRQLGWGADS